MELAETSFYSFHVASGTNSAGREVELDFYFWRTSPQTVGVRVYVDGGDFIGSPTVPVLVGRMTLRFLKDGTKDDALPILVRDSPRDLLDCDPLPSAESDIEISLPWNGKPTERILIRFDHVGLTNSKSVVDTVVRKEILVGRN